MSGSIPPTLSTFLSTFSTSVSQKNGVLLANLFNPFLQPRPLLNFQVLADELNRIPPSQLSTILQNNLPLPDDVTNRFASWQSSISQFLDLVKVLVQQPDNFSRIHEILAKLLDSIGIIFNYWHLPLLKFLVDSFITAAFEADTQRIAKNLAANRVADSVRTLQGMIAPMVMDNRDWPNTRKVGVLVITNQAFKIFFKLGELHLFQAFYDNLVKRDNIDWTPFPKSQLVTFRFYLSRWLISEYRFQQAEKELEIAFDMCPTRFFKNKKLILMYLLTTRLVLGKTLPMESLLAKYQLSQYFTPLLRPYKSGNMLAFQHALEVNRRWFMKHGIYLALRERTKMVLWRNFMRNVLVQWSRVEASLSGMNALSNNTNMSKSVIIPLDSITQVLGSTLAPSAISGALPEIEYILVSLIEQGFIKAYISHAQQKIVFSGANAIPSLKEVWAKQLADTNVYAVARQSSSTALGMSNNGGGNSSSGGMFGGMDED